MDHQIAMLWMRGDLSFLERLCVQSFLDAGHHVILYSYAPVGRVPEGVEHRDAADILPEEGFLVHERTGSPALHSDLFRYRLLEHADRTIWADTDAYCRQPFRPREGHLHGWESDKHVNGGVLGLPKDCPTLHALLDFTRDEFAIPPWEKKWRRRDMAEARERGEPVHVSEQTWGVWGPHAITHFLSETGEISRALPQVALYPYSFAMRRRLVMPGKDHSGAITDETQSIHLYGRRIRKRMAERDQGLPDPDSLMGQLLMKHRIDPCEAPLRDWPNPDRDHPFARVYREAAEGKRYTAATPAPVRPLDDVVAITTMKNEGPFILDWVAYHLAVGITHFLVYTNDCDDPTCEILDALAARGLVTRVDNPVTEGERPQRVALKLAEAHPRVSGADAHVVMDVDEYINIHTGQGTLTDLFRAAGDPDMISMTWRFFGSNGVSVYADDPVARQFTRAAPLKVRKPHQNWGFKTIVRKGAPFASIGVHRPLDPTTGRMPRWTNGSGKQMPDKYLADGWRSNVDCWGYDLVTLNHYSVRSVDSFLVKRDRGRTNHISRDQGLDYWAMYDRNDEDDASILPRLDRAAPVRRVFALDPVLGPLHDKAVAWHRAKIAELKTDPEFRALYDHLATGAPAPEPAERPAPVRRVTAPPRSSTGRVTEAGDPIFVGAEAEAAYASLQSRAERLDLLAQPRNPLPRDRITVVTSMRNEAPFILEWIAYHKSIGVTDFLVFTNDCEDPTVAILDRLQALGHLTRIDNPFDASAGERPQWVALSIANDHPLVTEADWRIVIDVDEFINIHVGDGTLGALLTEANDPNVLSMTWRFFGNGGVTAYEDQFVTEQFTRAAPRFIPKPRLGWGFKSMTHRSAPFAKLGVHRPQDLIEGREGEVRWVNGSGRQMPEQLVTGGGWRSTKRTIGYDMVTLNHYVLRSAESYLVKRERGRINHVDEDQGVDYFLRRDYASETERSILARLPDARRVWADLMSDDALARLHEEAVHWHKTRIADLMARPDYRSLFKAITDEARTDAIFSKSLPADSPLELAD